MGGRGSASRTSRSGDYYSNGGPAQAIETKAAIQRRLEDPRPGDIVEIGNGSSYLVISRVEDTPGGIVYYRNAAWAPWMADDGPEFAWQSKPALRRPANTIDNPTYPVTRIVSRKWLRDRYESLS